MSLLFAYGSLQQEEVQLSTFGRLLVGQRDELCGFELGLVKIADPKVAAALGRSHHANVIFTGREGSRVAGTAYEVEDSELPRVDRFEAEFSYERVDAELGSGRRAWVYVHAPDDAPAPDA
jgi:gamma-glutamylcyclotransferase (GGCT)/AIG2-like uncharacterized protein YtfP